MAGVLRRWLPESWRQARELMERVARVYERQLGPNASELAIACLRLADVHEDAGDVAAQQAAAERGLAILERQEHAGLSLTGGRITLGRALTAAGDAARAMPMLERAVQAYEQVQAY